MTLATTVLLGIIYPLVVTALAQVLYPHHANGELIESRGKLVGSRLIGQPFTSPGYFHSRPSSAGAAGHAPPQSGGGALPLGAPPRLRSYAIGWVESRPDEQSIA